MVPSRALEQDTTEATTSDDEIALEHLLRPHPVRTGVWFTATAMLTPRHRHVTGSDYSAGIIVLSGEPGNLSPLLCGPGIVSGPVVAGQTIYLLVFGDGAT